MDGESIGLAPRGVGALASARILGALCAASIITGWALSSTGAFTVDEYFYARAAEAMAEEGALDFRQFDAAGAPALDMNFASPSENEGRLAPQYPSGYAILAAPFFAAFGVKGLTLVNALAAIASLFLTHRIARRLGADETEAALSVAIAALATYWTTYAFAIWPHMLALAVVLAAIERLFAAGEGSARAALAAGLLCGLGETIRVDAIVLAPAAIAYFRCFCEGDTRRLSLLFLAAAAAGLAAAASLNFLKFGAFSPIAYENAVASNDPSAYVLPALAVGAALCAALVIDPKAALPSLRRPSAQALIAVACVAAVAAFPPARRLLHGLWYTLVDSQAYQFLDRQTGIERNQWGWLVFYGFSKKALLQSLPFLALLLLPAIRLWRGEGRKGDALPFLIAGGFAALYSWNETDSGLGFNARFLLPILPIAGVFAAREIIRVRTESGVNAATMWGLALASATGFMALRMSFADPGPYSIPVDLYPQLALAAALACVVVRRAALPTLLNARAMAALGTLAIGAGAGAGATDFLRDQSYRAFVRAQAALYQDVIPDDAFVLTTRPALFTEGALGGLGVAYPGTDSVARTVEAIRAHQSAGRSAFLHGEGAREWLLAGADLAVAPVLLPAGSRQGPLFVIKEY